MGKERYGYVLPLACPGCGNDFTQEGSLTVKCVGNNGVCLGEFPDHVETVEGTTVGVLADSEGLVEIGKHAQTFCAACQFTELYEKEVQFTWSSEKSRRVALVQAVRKAQEAS